MSTRQNGGKIMSDKIVNTSGELLYKLVPEKKDDKDGYRLYRVKPTKFGNTVINTDDICGWISNQIQQQNIEDFYLDKESSIYDGRVNNSIIYRSVIRGSDSLIENSTLFDSDIAYSVIKNSTISESNISYSQIDTCQIENGSINDSVSEVSTCYNFGLTNGEVSRSVILGPQIKNIYVTRSNIQLFEDLNMTNITNAYIRSPYDYMAMQGIGSCGAHRKFSATRMESDIREVYIHCGCWEGRLEEFIERVESVYGASPDNHAYKEYKTLIELIKIYFEESYPMILHQDVRLAQMERVRHLMLRDSLIFRPIIEYM